MYTIPFNQRMRIIKRNLQTTIEDWIAQQARKLSIICMDIYNKYNNDIPF